MAAAVSATATTTSNTTTTTTTMVVAVAVVVVFVVFVSEVSEGDKEVLVVARQEQRPELGNAQAALEHHANARTAQPPL